MNPPSRSGRGGTDGWYSRGYLPHFDAAHLVQSVSFRLADSLPQEKLRTFDDALSPDMDRSVIDREKREQIDHWLDAGIGSCVLAHPPVARMVQDALLCFDGQRYRLIAWCIMPNHVHVLLEPFLPLSVIVKSWKSYTGRTARKLMTPDMTGGLSERFWMREYWDRYIRNESHLEQAVHYIHENPVKAGLCLTSVEWPWSSAGYAIAAKSS